MADSLDGSDHSALIRDWLAMAKQKLVDRESGLLISSFTTDDTPLAGPEGSSIWMVAHSLQLLDEDFARDQYERARKELAQSRSVSVTHTNGRNRGKARPILIPARSFRYLKSALARVAWPSSAPAHLAMTDFSCHWQPRWDFAGFPSRTHERLEILRKQSGGRCGLALCRNAWATLAKGKNWSKTMIKNLWRSLGLFRRAEFLSPRDLLHARRRHQHIVSGGLSRRAS